MKKLKKRLILVLVFSASFYSTSIFLARDTGPKERYVSVVHKILPTIVTIAVNVSRIKPETANEVQHGTIFGSGVFITKNGHILSCAHLFNHPYYIESILVKTQDDWILPAIVLYIDGNRDLSLLKIEGKLTPYETSPYSVLATPGSLQVGQEVIAIGTPLGLQGTVTTGVISALGRDQIHYNMVQMSAPINPGNSGGPLFNLKGEIVGINVNIMSPIEFLPLWTGLGFSVSIDEINIFLTNFKGIEKAIRS